MSIAEDLLKPISADKPCGPDLSYDPRFDELESILKGEPEVDIGSVKKPAEPPDWGELKDKSAQFLSQSKHLRVGVMMCCSLLKTGGIVGFLDGLQLLRGLVEQYWPTVYPLLDPEDNNDPTQRLNILGGLTAQRGSAGGWLAILDYLYTTPVCRPKGMAPITFDDIQAARRREKGGEGVPANAPDPAKLSAAMRDGAGEQIVANHKALQQALEAVRAVDQFLTTTLGAGNTISFEGLEKALLEMVGGLESYLPGAAAQGADAAAVTGDSGSIAGISVRGSIRSRDDVVRAIDSICDYYRQVEPCSPVPYLLRRAQKLAAMDFVQAVQELNLATIDSLRPSMGSAVDAGSPPPGEVT
jgi:type VI secretion system protein ImpA